MKVSVAFAIVSLFLLSCETKQGGPRPVPQSATTQTGTVPVFGGNRAFAYLTTQTGFGPRSPGSPGYRQCLNFLQGELMKSADSVFIQPFSFSTYKGEPFTGNNLIARFGKNASQHLLLSAHWDTRPWADQDENKALRTKPVPGANDGASGVAVLLEIATALKSSPPAVGVDIVLYDAEDVGESGRAESYAQGSQYFARHLPEGTVYRFAINLDMVGDKNLEIRREANSDAYAPQVMDLVFSTARLLGFRQFIDEKNGAVFDDHMPLNNAGIPAIDLIDFNYPDESNRFWHTTLDTPDKCGAESLEAVGTVLLNVIYGQRPAD